MSWCVSILLATTARGGGSFSVVGKHASRGVLRAHDVECLVVGGGPGGLAAGLTMQTLGISTLVVEQRASADEVEAEKAYLYLVDKRGQQLLDRRELTSTLSSRGVSNENFTLIRITPEGVSKPVYPPIKSDGAYWITRASFCSLLDSAARNAGVKLRYGCAAKPQADGSVEVDGVVYRPRYLVGADGISSGVAKTVLRSEPVRINSPSAGLHYKILGGQLEFRDTQTNCTVELDPEQAYSAPSLPKARLKLGLLPMKRGSATRTANIVADPSHPIFGFRTVAGLRRYLYDAFPQLQHVPDQTLSSFAAAEAGAFPKPQYRRTLAARVGAAQVFLVGDAAHAFPPDLGQGVNSALEDVLCLEDCLEQERHSAYLTYNRRRSPAARALAHLVAVGFPYQYSQGTKLQRTVFISAFFARLALSKVVPFVIARPAVLDVIQAKPYIQVWRSAQRTTALFYLLASGILFLFVRQLLFLASGAAPGLSM